LFPVPYWLSDGIYFDWAILATPHKEEAQREPHGTPMVIYNVKQESRRKDVECAIGMLRKKWK